MNSADNRMKLEINKGRKFGKFKNMWEFKNTLLTNGSKKKSQGKLEDSLR